jgi:hypothetical protein
VTQIVSTSQLQPDGLRGYRKAIGAFIVSFGALLTDAWADGSITTAEWKTIGIGSVSAAFIAWLLPNAVRPTPPAPVDPAPNG